MGWAAVRGGERPAPVLEPSSPGEATLGMGNARSKKTQVCRPGPGGRAVQSRGGRLTTGRMDGWTRGGSLCRQHTPPGGAAGAGPPRSSLGSVAAGRGPAHGNPRAGGGPTSGHSCKGRQLLPAAPVCPPDARRRGKATTDGDAPDQDTPSTGLPDGQGLHLPPGEDTQASGLGPWPVRLRPTPCWLIPKRCHAVASRKYLFVASQKLPSGGNGVCTHSVTRGGHRCRGLVFNWAQ